MPLLAVLLFCLLPASADAYRDSPELRAFIEELAVEHGFAQSELQAIFRGANYQQSVIDSISRPAERTLEWREYRPIFLTQQRIENGAAFWSSHRAALDKAEQVYGVPASVIVAIMGVETLYGQRMGTYRVLDSLTTLAFDYPPRATFFRKELKEFLLLAREERRDITELLGSYAGAMGYGQFIPSSFRNHAVDFDGDGVRDVWSNSVDAIGSVANYLNAYGWKRGGPVASRARLVSDLAGEAASDDVKPVQTVAELELHGIVPVDSLSPGMKAAPFSLNGDHGTEYWLSLDNFYVITRYNHSKLYAMAVYQLSRAISEYRNATASPAAPSR